MTGGKTTRPSPSMTGGKTTRPSPSVTVGAASRRPFTQSITRPSPCRAARIAGCRRAGSRRL
ncbi:MAG TPA: hypothetical protein VGG81_11415, partial [Edaphobacter sp.]